MKKNKTILIIAGGSGGHVFPGLVVARYLMSNGYKVVWLGTKNHIESKLVPLYNIDIEFINMEGFRGKKIYKKLIVLFFLFFLSMYQTIKIIRFWRPGIVLSMGGYVSAPSSIIAWLFGIPIIIHEQNRVMGLTNRFLIFFSKKLLQGFPSSTKKSIVSGNPLRRSIISISNPKIRWKNRSGPIRVLVIGGSNGADIFNIVVPKIFKKLFNKLSIWHQSGKQHFKYVTEAYRNIHKSHYKVMPFIDNIEYAYEWADVVISRSGALTVSEIICVGLPAIFVPFIYHKDRQQYWNAVPLERVGAAIIVEQNKFTSDYISQILESWNRKILLDMAQRAKTLFIPNATQLVSETIITTLNSIN